MGYLASDNSSCASQESAVVVDLDNQKHARVLGHAWSAISQGRPILLHIDRKGADENRRESLRGIPTKKGFDRDEYPPAIAEEGGVGASVRLIRSSENRSAGSIMGRQLRPWCNGQLFMYEGRP